MAAKFHFCFLNWSIWSKAYDEVWTKESFYCGVSLNNKRELIRTFQSRECNICGKKEVREIKR